MSHSMTSTNIAAHERRQGLPQGRTAAIVFALLSLSGAFDAPVPGFTESSPVESTTTIAVSAASAELV